MAKYRARIVGTTTYPDDSTAGVNLEYAVEAGGNSKAKQAFKDWVADG